MTRSPIRFVVKRSTGHQTPTPPPWRGPDPQSIDFLAQASRLAGGDSLGGDGVGERGPQLLELGPQLVDLVLGAVGALLESPSDLVCSNRVLPGRRGACARLPHRA